MRESVIENYLVQEVQKAGGRAYKFTSAAYRAIPDRMCVFPHGFIIFVEVKAPGRKPTRRQNQEIAFLRKLGQTVVILDSRPRVDALIEWYRRQLHEKFRDEAT